MAGEGGREGGGEWGIILAARGRESGVGNRINQNEYLYNEARNSVVLTPALPNE
ncbi:MAG: hypothetical protein IPL78_32455 [Chloroflexi bacterium]|nr:hypothetical protein [Chloroflexota bacterium]